MQLYQFEKIFSRMKKEFGMLKREEPAHIIQLLYVIEGNALKIHRKFPSSNSRRMREAVALALFSIQDKYTGATTDTSQFRNEDNERLEKAILMAFDPFTNEQVSCLFSEQLDGQEPTKEILKEYYKHACRCLVKIADSVSLFIENLGSDGYFQFMETHIGSKVTDNEKMDFAMIFDNQNIE